jgi:hypothetical protein
MDFSGEEIKNSTIVRIILLQGWEPYQHFVPYPQAGMMFFNSIDFCRPGITSQKIVEEYQLLQTPAHLFCRDMQRNGNFTKP